MLQHLYKPLLFSAFAFVAVSANSQQIASAKTGGISKADSLALMDKGKAVFTNTCKACHGNPAFPKAPSLQALAEVEPRSILNTLDNGKMRQQAKALTENQREAVAQYIAHKLLKKITLPKDAYTKFELMGSDMFYNQSGWGGNLEGTGFRDAERAGIDTGNVGSLTLKWAFAFPGESEMRSKPSIAGDWLIMGSGSGEVYAINWHTGKIGWHITAATGIRSGIAVAKRNDGAYIAYFADGSTNVYAVNVRTGKILWSTRAGVDPLAMNTGTVAVYAGKVIVPISSIEVAVAADSSYKCCTSSGGVAALDAATGNMLWYHRVVAQKATAQGKKKNGQPFYGPAGAPVWCSPTIDTKRKLVYIGTGENYTQPTTNTSDALQAIDLNTGKLVWNFQATRDDAWNIACPVLINCPGKQGKDFDFGMAPILVTGADGQQRLLAGQKAGLVYALNPQDGKLLWQTRVGKGGMLGGVHWGMAADGKNVYAANADNVFGLNLDSANIKAAPGIYALDVITGKINWYTASPKVQGSQGYLGVNSAAPVVTTGLVFAGSNDGHIRAYSTEDGHILWDYNTAQTYTAVDGVEAKGGSIDCAAPIMANGMLFVNSGYAQFGEKPGNVLLAFSVKE